MCENEYGSAKRCEFSLLQMLPSHRPNLPSGPDNERPIHSSMPPVRASTAMKMRMTFLVCRAGSDFIGGPSDHTLLFSPVIPAFSFSTTTGAGVPCRPL